MALRLNIDNPWPRATVVVKERTGSTMEDAYELARQGAPSGSAVVAGWQEKGRGRAPGRTWSSPPWESLLMTVAFTLSELPCPPSQLPLRTAAAVVRSVDGVLPSPAEIKWPNDVLCRGLKLAGILCEGRGGIILAGIGVNCAQKAFPEDLAGRACSLLQLGAEVAVPELAARVLLELASCVKDPGWLEEVRGRLSGRGAEVSLSAPGGEELGSGTVVDVSPAGGLILRGKDGRLREILQGEIR